MGRTAPAGSARSEYVQARLDAILSRGTTATPPQRSSRADDGRSDGLPAGSARGVVGTPPVEPADVDRSVAARSVSPSVVGSATVLAARRRRPSPLLTEALGRPRRGQVPDGWSGGPAPTPTVGGPAVGSLAGLGSRPGEGDPATGARRLAPPDHPAVGDPGPRPAEEAPGRGSLTSAPRPPARTSGQPAAAAARPRADALGVVPDDRHWRQAARSAVVGRATVTRRATDMGLGVPWSSTDDERDVAAGPAIGRPRRTSRQGATDEARMVGARRGTGLTTPAVPGGLPSHDRGDGTRADGSDLRALEDRPRRPPAGSTALVDRVQGPRAGSFTLADRSVTLQVPQLTRRHLVVLAAVLALAVAFSAFLLLRARADSPPVVLATETTTAPAPAPPTEPGTVSSPTPVPQVVVHVLGAVEEPGVVSLPQGARVGEAIERAGGLTEDARPGELNLAQVLADGQQVVVSDDDQPSEVRADGGATGGATGGGTGGGGGGSAAGGAGAQLDLNTATVAQLEELPGVGPVTAQKILDWRTEHGRFSRVEELQEVSGIGPKSYAEIAPHVRV